MALNNFISSSYSEKTVPKLIYSLTGDLHGKQGKLFKSAWIHSQIE